EISNLSDRSSLPVRSYGCTTGFLRTYWYVSPAVGEVTVGPGSYSPCFGYYPVFILIRRGTATRPVDLCVLRPVDNRIGRIYNLVKKGKLPKILEMVGVIYVSP